MKAVLKTVEIQDLILTTLGTQDLTASQLHAQLNTNERIRAFELSEARLRTILADMVRKRQIAKHNDPAHYLNRYSVIIPGYRSRHVIDTHIVERRHPDIDDHWIEIGRMTQDEAVACVAALNRLKKS